MTSVSPSKTALNIVMGAMTFGEVGKEGARVHDIHAVEAILDKFRSHGHTEIDSARTYTGGTSEEYLGKIDLVSKGFKIETKLSPNKNWWSGPISHDYEVFISSSADGSKIWLIHGTEFEKEPSRIIKSPECGVRIRSLEMWYLHRPDHTVPYEITFKAINELYKEGYFKRLGISNYSSWEVAEIVALCKANGYIQPTAYQGIYNAIHRAVEPELFPCLRKFGISFYEFNALAGGFFTGRYVSLDDTSEEGSRFDPNKIQGRAYRNRYWNEPYFKALASIREIAQKHNLTLTEIAWRWVSHHSQLKREHGDSVLIGASNLAQLEENLIDLEKGPLPEEVVKSLDEAWFNVQSYASRYFR